ncbi:uncharacterized protein UMAG_10048 [Mycosarcoma maydis]|uniref:Cytochrome c oxidase subunit 8, mitochondrial n=1 Tax=Mycosarcoma maydis TaxID=5270 RepID=A0A0D1EBN0_MYCMD|nr:uncharacterized protein UMAG_10048 [Ustilago maydis 521]KIS71750.1 hypothetical protein UMAG_10048 [Ustilago maydis 521]|eukprot:XP_011386637.1 hypothetical protein UMAG_10048 [Ustilago maydis 521]
MSMLARQTVRTARTALRQQQAPLLRRNLHVENTHETSLPFPSGPTRKVPVAISLTTFFVVGFSLPFVAAKFQIAKASW